MGEHAVVGRGGQVFVRIALVALTVLVAAAPASADVSSFEVEEYMRDFDVSPKEAKEAREAQAKGVEADIVARLESRFGDRYAGVWFDNERGEFVVPLLPNVNTAAVDNEFSRANLSGDDFRFTGAESSWQELEAAQDRINAALGGLLKKSLLQTGLDPRTNAVVVIGAGGISEGQEAHIETVAARENASVELRKHDVNRFRAVPTACKIEEFVRFCDNPLRGGVGISRDLPPEIPFSLGSCSVAFKATGNTTGDRYVLTGGHCVNEHPKWKSTDAKGSEYTIGTVEQYSFPGGDWAKIKANGSYWDTPNWPTQVAWWGVDESYSIEKEGTSFVGQSVCHSGTRTGSSCGYVTLKDYSPGYGVHHITKFAAPGLCINKGDSGGPVFANHVALGIISGMDEETPECNRTGYFIEITEAAAALGVTVGSDTKTTVNATALNGNPGWVTVKGEVKSLSGTINNKKVQVKLFKWENNEWINKTEPPLEATVNNNNFEIKEWEGVGVGSWSAKAIFPAQASFAASSNHPSEGAFTVKDGYRIVNKNSAKCLDVANVSKDNNAAMQQWECHDPKTAQNQVFTLVPQGNGRYQIRARHSGRCVDVTGNSPNDGAALQQYTCGSQTNQHWSLHDVGGGYAELRVNHVNPAKCMDVAGASKSNGGGIQQWACNGGAQQKWELQSVESDKIPTTTGINAPEGERLNGEPGYATVWGYVHTGAYGIGGNTVKVSYYKKNGSGQYEYIKAQNPTLNSEGRYEVKYEGLGSGDWQIQAWWPGISNLGESSSPTINVHIGSGYRFKFRHSDKCMSLAQNNPQNANGVGIIQWDCAAQANPNDGQVFTLVPYENGTRFQIEINQTDKCVDVKDASSANLAWYQQWSCSKPPTDWQLFGVVPISGQVPWNAFQAKHSGKCADVLNASKNNGERVVQYDCHWGSNQQWKFEGIG